MDENTWRFAQLIMWLIGAQTAFITAVIGFVWNNLSKRMEKLDERLVNLDKRVTVIETILQMKECCMLKDDRQMKKAE